MELMQKRNKGQSLILFPDDYIVIDIETTGLDPDYCSIIEVGAIRIQNRQIMDTFSSLIKPQNYVVVMQQDKNNDDYIIHNGETVRFIDKFISELTGITNRMLANAPSEQEVLPNFFNFIGDSVLVGHNVNFDINFLYDRRMSLFSKPLNNNFIDTLRISRKLFKNYSNHKLTTLVKNLGVADSIEHRAESDCLYTMRCFEEMRKYVLDNKIDMFELSQSRHGRGISLNSICATVDSFDESNLLYGKCCVFTGILERMLRREAAQLVVNSGGICENTVTKKTNYLILGNNDFCKSVKDGKSLKQKKAEELILKGADLQIISENVFYDMLSDE